MGSSNLEMAQGLNYKLKPGQPIIVSNMPSQKVITVSIQGDPNEQTSRVMPPLYASAYAVRKFFIEEHDQKFSVEKLRGRWPDANAQRVKKQWTGTYALPVPNDTRKLESIKPEKQVPGVTVALATWEYGAVGQILHVGPYTKEGPTIQSLRTFVEKQGYQIVPNSHEEIYLTDPTKADPDKMRTLILCRLAKK